MSDQDDDPAIDPISALDRVLEELRREFRSNPEFAYRVVKALGAEVLFEGKDAHKLINLRELAGASDNARLMRTLEGLSLAEIKAVAKSNNLATAVDMKGMDKETLIDKLVARARHKVAERRSEGGEG
jgi:hypothetical protein